MAWNLITEYAVELNIKNNLYDVHLTLGPKRHEALQLKSAAELNAVLTVLTKSYVLFNDEDKTIKCPYTPAGPQHQPSSSA